MKKITEEEWLTTERMPAYLLSPLTRKQDRKRRLFGSACCRRGIALVQDERLGPFCDAIEDFADGVLTWKQMHSVRRELNVLYRSLDLANSFGPQEALIDTVGAMKYSTDKDAVSALHSEEKIRYTFAATTRKSRDVNLRDRAIAAEEREHVRLAHDIFGNPFRKVHFDNRWRTSTAIGLSQTMYDARDFGAMPILADALEDAGCEDAAILSHCRDPHGVHVRGCWVVDLVLGKS